MEGNMPLEEIIQQLRKQNYELAQRLQFFKMEYAKSEEGRLKIMNENNVLTQENNGYKEKISKFKNIETIVKLSVKRSLTDIVKGSEHMKHILEVFSDQDIDFSEKTSPKRFSNQSSALANNVHVHHVHPMIRGITIKKPIIRISRAVLEPITEPLAASVVSENTTSIMNEEEHHNSPSQNASTPTQQVEMLDLCVSLCRVDSPDRRTRTPKKILPLTSPDVGDNTNNQSCNPFGNQAAAAMAAQQAVTEDSVYTDENGKNCNFLPEGSFEYSSRLECVVEETEHDSLKWSNSSKPNPFVALSRTLEEDVSKSSSENNAQSPKADEDPLEGPSWRFENIATTRNQFVSIRKRKKTSFRDNSTNDKSEDVQLPDSTTNGSIKDISAEHTQFDKTFPCLPDFQSTPVSDCLSYVNKEPRRPGNNEIISLPSPCKLPEETNTSSSDCSIENLTSKIRPRRGDTKNYKEKPLNKKLRRN